MPEPIYTVTCPCGLTIGGNNEKGLAKLSQIHIEGGVIHQAWVKKTGRFDDQPFYGIIYNAVPRED